MRYVIKQSPDPAERNRYFDALDCPVIGKRLSHCGRRYEVMDVEVRDPLSRGTAQEVWVSVRRVG